MRRLFPDPGPVDPTRLIPETLVGRSHGPRPYLVANFVSSVDGRATVDGGSTALGDDGDRRIFRSLRGCADAVLVGTGTLAAEHYGTLARDPAVVAMRARLGLGAQPPLVTVTRSGQLPSIPLLDDPAASVIVYSGVAPSLGDVAATVHVELRDAKGLVLGAVLEHLKAHHGIGLLLCEGGPSILGELVSGGLCDELFLTLAGTLAGGDGPAIIEGLRLPAPRPVELRWVLGQAESLYLRYALRA